MLHWEEEEIHTMQTRQQKDNSENNLHLPSHQSIDPKHRPSCPVCKLELHMKKKKKIKDNIGSGYRNKTNMVKCTQCKGDICLHWTLPKNSDSKIFNLPEFEGMSCFEIFHSDKAKGLWSISEKRTVSPCTGNRIYKTLSNLWAIEPESQNNAEIISTANTVTKASQEVTPLVTPENHHQFSLQDDVAQI